MIEYVGRSYGNPSLDRSVEMLRKLNPENEVILDMANGIVSIFGREHPLFNILREMRLEKNEQN